MSCIISSLTGYRYHELEFTADGSRLHAAQVDAVTQLAGEVDDLIVISHGWNNSADDARGLYGRIAESFDATRSAGHEPELGGRVLAVAGVIWPSKRFAEQPAGFGNVAAVGHADATLADDLVASAGVFDHLDANLILGTAAALVPELDTSRSARNEYADLLRSLVLTLGPDEPSGSPAPPDKLFSMDGSDLLNLLDPAALVASLPPDVPAAGGNVTSVGGLGAVPGGMDTGGIAGIGAFLHDLGSKGRALLNYVTYYQMKSRAGVVGKYGLAPALRDALAAIDRSTPLRVHFVGHSFGARLVTAAAEALPSLSPAAELGSVSLLQGAFSHYSFANAWDGTHDGAYRAVVGAGRLTGPMIITHTRNDTAVGIAYAIASRVADQVASAIGDENDRFGGLGSNGAQRTPEADDSQPLGDVDVEYELRPGAVHNLRADQYVKNHSDVGGQQVAHAVLRAVATHG